MSQPPGYNPSESLLQGGTTSITPLMGGGGFIEGNPNESMLDGGNAANITPLKGGRRTRRKGSKRRKRSRKHKGGNASMQTYKNTVDKTIELQKQTFEAIQPSEESTEQSGFFDILGKVTDTIKIDPPKKELTAEEKQAEFAKSILQAQKNKLDEEPEESAPAPPPPPTFEERILQAQKDKKDSLDNNVLTGGGTKTTEKFKPSTQALKDLSPKLSHVAKQYTRFMTIDSPWFKIRKDSVPEYTAKFHRNTGKVKPSTNGVNTADRLTVFLPNNTKNIYVFQAVNGNAETFSKIIASITEEMWITNVLIFNSPFFNIASKDNKNLMVHYIELKLKYPEKLYILTEHTGNNINVGYSISPENEPLLNMYEPTYIVYPHPVQIDQGDKMNGILFSAAAEDEVIIPKSKDNKYYSIGEYLANKNRGKWLVFPPGNSKDMQIETFFYTYKSTDFKEEITHFTIFDEKTDGLILDYTKFQAANDAIVIGISYKKIGANGTFYYFRKPLKGEAGDPVINDWMKGKFTPSEAKYLNDLHLRPDIVLNVFGVNWKEELANFLSKLVLSNCFEDLNMLTMAECSRGDKNSALNFVNKIFEYFLLHNDLISSMEDRDSEFSLQAAENVARKALEKQRMAEQRFVEAEETFKEQITKWVGVAEEFTHVTDKKLLDKNPYTDKVVEPANTYTWSPMVVMQNGRWKLTIMLVDRRKQSKDQYTFANIYLGSEIDIGDTDSAFLKMCKDLEGKYPAWRFIMKNNA